MNAFTDFKNSQETCFANFLLQNSKPVTPKLPPVEFREGWKPPDWYKRHLDPQLKHWACIVRANFAGVPIQISIGKSNSIKARGRKFIWDDLRPDVVSSIPPNIEINGGFFTCEWGMTYIIHYLRVLLDVLEKSPSCFNLPIYSQQHKMVQKERGFGDKNIHGCEKCLLKGYLSPEEYESQQTDPKPWKNHPAMTPPKNEFSPFLVHLEQLEHMFWNYPPFLLGKLMCTCKQFYTHMTTSPTLWKTLIVRNRPYLVDYYDELIAYWSKGGLSYPKLCYALKSIYPDPNPGVYSTARLKTATCYLRMEGQEYEFMVPNRFLSLKFLLPNPRLHSIYEITCWNRCLNCKEEIKFTNLDCPGDRNPFLFTSDQIREREPGAHVPVPGVDEFLETLGVKAELTWKEPEPEKAWTNPFWEK